MPTEEYISYKSDYKYQLAEDYKIHIPIKPKTNIKTGFIYLNIDGVLLIKKGYAWDGPSGPVKDTDKNMRASLVHDALYQLMRNGNLKTRVHRKTADKLFKDICKTDGVSSFIASLYYKALRKFGKPAASPRNKKKIVYAPKSKKLTNQS